jgi:hypothetical protein
MVFRLQFREAHFPQVAVRISAPKGRS